MPAYIRGHAFDRVSERLQMSPQEVADLLDQERYVLIGIEDGSSVAHKLIYSVLDNSWFVVIQDDVCGHVITILPAAFEKRMEVSADAIRQARLLAEGELPLKSAPSGFTGPSFWFNAVIEDRRGITRTISLKPVPLVGEATIDAVLEGRPMIEYIKKEISGKILFMEKVVSVDIRIGRKVKRVSIDLRRLYR